jgi:hypothetical protein
MSLGRFLIGAGVLARLRGVLQFIRSDDGRDGRKGDRGEGQVLGEATRALIWWPLGALQLWGATGCFFKFRLKVGVEESIIINPSRKVRLGLNN